MSDQAFVQWLLDAKTPSIRYLTLRNLLDRPDTDKDVQAARQEMEEVGPIPAILAKQAGAGHWVGEHSYYTPKYKSTHWSMTLLVELATNGADPRVRKGATFMLEDTWKELAVAPTTK